MMELFPSALLIFLVGIILFQPTHAAMMHEVEFKDIIHSCNLINWSWVSKGWEYPWVLPGGTLAELPQPGGSSVHVVPPSENNFLVNKLLLIVPLWREDNYYKTIIASYNISKLPLPKQSRIYRVMIPSGIVSHDDPWHDGVKLFNTEGPWRDVKYSLNDSNGWLVLEPCVDSEVYAVEVGLPTSGDWVELVVPPGSWLLALGWSDDFNILDLSGRVLFRGRAPYDEVQYDLGDVKLVFWYGWCLLNMSDKDFFDVKVKVVLDYYCEKFVMFNHVNFAFYPRDQYEEGVFYGPCTILRLDNRVPVILEFKIPEVGANAIDYVGCEENGKGFYSRKYLDDHYVVYSYSPPSGLLSSWGLWAPLIPPILVARRRVG